MSDRLSKALEAIENEDTVCFDVAAEHGQIFGNVKHMRWFAEAVAEALEESGEDYEPTNYFDANGNVVKRI